MSKINWIKRFEPLTEEKLLTAAKETGDWINQYERKTGGMSCWDVLPGTETDRNAFLLKDTGIYAGAAGIALFNLRLYVATGDKEFLNKAEAGIDYIIASYRGVDDFKTDAEFLAGAAIGFLNGPAGGAYVATQIYKYTGEEKYKAFARQVTDDLIVAGNDTDKGLTWYGFYGILGEGGLVLYLLDAYESYGEEKYLKAADRAALYIANQKEDAPNGGYRWNVMPTENFPTIGKPGGYFPGFEYGAAGCGYILAQLYKKTKNQEYLRIAQKAAEYIYKLADFSDDGQAALVRYNDTYLTDLYYLGVCQGPIGTSRLFYVLYEITGQEKYKDFVLQLTNGILATGAPSKHSEGYWRTNCYCCGTAGMLEHFINIHKLSGDDKYLRAAYDAAETLIGESTYKNRLRNWYTAWNRHEPETSDPYIGLYHGSAGCGSALLSLYEYISDKTYLPPYLEDPYKNLFQEEK